MATLSLRIDDELRDELEALAQRDGTSVSEVIRRAVDVRLGRDVLPAWSAPRTMSKPDRHMLALLHGILERLDPDEAEHHRRRITALERGFTGEYADEFVAFEEELSLAHCNEVWDILDMFTVLEASVEKIDPAEIAALDRFAKAALTFRGLDMRDELEGPMLSYANFLVAGGRWQSLAPHFDRAKEDGNSHSPCLPSYRRMLTIFKPLWKEVATAGRGRYHLTLDELRPIVDAWPHPR